MASADEPALSTAPLNQLFLDHMLACSVAQVEERAACFGFLSPVLNRRAVTLEALVGAVAGCTDATWPRVFRRRYLEYDCVSHLTHVAQGARGRIARPVSGSGDAPGE